MTKSPDQASQDGKASAADSFLMRFEDDFNTIAAAGTRRPAPPAGTSVLAPRLAPQPVVTDVLEPTPPPAPVAVKSAPRRARRSETAKQPDDAPLDDGKTPAAWVPIDIKTRLDAERARTGLTITELFVRAFNEQYKNLDAWFPVIPESKGPMPEADARHGTRQVLGAAVVIRLRLNPGQRTVLDEEVTRRRTSRGALVTRVLDEALPPLAAE